MVARAPRHAPQDDADCLPQRPADRVLVRHVRRNLTHGRLTQAPQRGPHRPLRRVTYAHVPRVLGEVCGRRVAPIALVDHRGHGHYLVMV